MNGLKQLIAVNHDLNDLKTENARLSRELLFANKCVRLLMRFKSYLYDYCVHQNKCETDYANRLQLRYLENEFNILVKEKNDFNLTVILNDNEFNEENNANLITAENYEVIDTNERQIESQELSGLTEDSINSTQINNEENHELIRIKVENNDSETAIAKNNKQTVNCKGYQNEFNMFLNERNNFNLETINDNEFTEENNYADIITAENYYEIIDTIRSNDSETDGERRSDLTKRSNNSTQINLGEDHDLIVIKTENNESEEAISESSKESVRRGNCFYNKRPKRNLKCDWSGCSYHASRRSKLESHMNRHLGLQPFRCLDDDCDKTFYNEHSMKQHYNYVHKKQKTIPCELPDCTVMFKNMSSLREHMRTHNTPPQLRPFPCDFAGCSYRAVSKASLGIHKVVHSDDKPFACEVCGKSFKMKATMKEHQFVHVSEPQFRCEWPGCDVVYRSKTSLFRHKLKHKYVDSRIHRCDWPGCEYRSDRLSSVKKHKARHSDERNFPCSWPSCDIKLKTRDNLIDHLKIHTNDKRHKCQWPGCDYACVHIGNLKKHFRVHCK